MALRRRTVKLGSMVATIAGSLKRQGPTYQGNEQGNMCIRGEEGYPSVWRPVVIPGLGLVPEPDNRPDADAEWLGTIGVHIQKSTKK